MPDRNPPAREYDPDTGKFLDGPHPEDYDDSAEDNVESRSRSNPALMPSPANQPPKKEEK